MLARGRGASADRHFLDLFLILADLAELKTELALLESEAKQLEAKGIDSVYRADTTVDGII